MTNYSENSGSVKVDFYKPSGKWYMTEAWDMSKYYTVGFTSTDAVIQMFEDKGKRDMLDRFIVVVDEPYHEQEVPVMLVPEVMWRAKYEADAEKRDSA
jgi:hypothetical protein